MPKIIENVRGQLLDEARRQIKEQGYAKTTIRSVAGACGLGVGTVYNYFSSKDMLIASFMLEDWQRALDEMKKARVRDARGRLLSVYDLIAGFIRLHKSLFSDSDAAKSFNISQSEYHRVLRAQIASMLAPVSSKTEENEGFLYEFIAESLLTWTVEGKSFDEIYSVLQSILK